MRISFLVLMLIGSPLCVAADEHSGMTQQQVMEQRDQLLIIDVRGEEEYAQGHVPGALHMPHDQVDANLPWLSEYKDKKIVLYCRTGRRSGMVQAQLLEKGFTDVSLLKGDMPGWESAGLPIEKGSQ
ncbi:rhodanese-like domain-containing protein [Aliiglaciecola sp. CAU 1673]|uniref:rhodanese-like domain-containing protein n=1 Tax=Aliiglaciecola sp. CAU 1673 TaxID=3032595 RepID=UPI0023DA93CC|nr:rhodanese-like domain-containing protein [Aliiglaciecola sp. CAU 1673]MDF2178512.1 rhodanese-like domain-containing protein [Aliiglaciecola sp. CAU 1673]